MTIAYVDTSAAMKLATREPESEALYDELSRGNHRTLASSWLLHAELHCAARRHPTSIANETVQSVLRSIVLADVMRGDLIAAGTLAPLWTHDAIHLAVAMRIGASEMLTYDHELAEAAGGAGLTVLSPR